jgi:hypothetical protein
MLLAIDQGMGVKKLEDLRAFQLARSFKRECYRLVHEHPRAAKDFDYSAQLFGAASGGESNIGEGYGRYVAGDIVRFLRIAISSIDEAMVSDGVDRRYFTGTEVVRALELGDRVRRTTVRQHNSLLPFVKRGHASLWTPPDAPAPKQAKGRLRRDVPAPAPIEQEPEDPTTKPGEESEQDTEPDSGPPNRP